MASTTRTIHNNNLAVSSTIMWRMLHLIIGAALLSGYALACVYLGNAVVTLIWGE